MRFRIDGVLHEMQSADRSIQDGVISRLKIMSSIDIAERRVPQDGRISVLHEGRSVDLRVATLPTVWGEKIVMRILDNTGQVMTMEDLRFSTTNGERFQQAITRPHGMILVTGPTGSGKSTTLYTALRTVADPRVNVITVEDPVEYRIPGINQVQVNPRAGLTFATALRSILRSDPDVVLVGEIRDRETAVGCANCSNTGYRGRVALHEVMTVTDEIEQRLVARSTGAELRDLALEQGMIALREDGWEKVADGITTIEEVLRVSA